MNAKGPKGQMGQKFGQRLVTQEPVYDRKMKLHRPKKRKSGQWLGASGKPNH